MKKKLFLFFIVLGLLVNCLNAQIFYVDVLNGNDINPGLAEAPFQSISKAVTVANRLTGKGSITIRVMPGIYTLEDKVAINPVRILDDTSRFIIEAGIMPDDDLWSPEKMPVIQSISGNNSTTFFPHSTGFLVSSINVTISGLKFLGNANPLVDYYYPIAKEDQTLKDLEVSQCYFIGNKEAAKIQGAVWAHGPGNTISHCIFYQCRNAVLFFNNVDGFTIKNSIVTGAYESAFWFGPDDFKFNFTNNVIANNNNFLVGRSAELKFSSAFSNSVIANNNGFAGYWSREKKAIIPIAKPNIVEKKIIKSGAINLIVNNAVKLDKKHLHLTEDSKGYRLAAGIFKK
ncbi:MAG: right-handed parallel beta-helix repeat-containing protein [Cytophagales bacterium]|nr:right-handed parallel beta-helix repeat-containing protein [Cytophagales bacterium]